MVRSVLWCVAVMGAIASTNYEELGAYRAGMRLQSTDGSGVNSREVFDSKEEVGNRIFDQDGCSCWADLKWRADRYAQENMLVDHDQVEGSDCYDIVMNVPSYDPIQRGFERALARPRNMRYMAFPCARCGAYECENVKVPDLPQQSGFSVDSSHEPIGDLGLKENRVGALNWHHA